MTVFAEGARAGSEGPSKLPARTHSSTREGDSLMKWTKPQYQDLRFGFEITMYIAAR